MKTASVFCLLAVFELLASDSLQSQTRPLPILVNCKQSFLNGSYVVQIKNSSNDTLNLWLQAKGKISPFLLPAGRIVEFGRPQHYRFDANNLFLIGGSGFDTVRQVTPNIELSPWRIGFSKNGGLALSLSQSYVQKKAKDFKFPIRRSFSSLEIEINQVPQMELREGSNRMYAHCIIEASVSGRKIPVPILATLSFIPEYIPDTGQLVASQIQIETIDRGIFPQQYIDDTTNLVNALLPVVFSSYELYKLSKNLLPFAKLFKVQDARVTDGRLELSIF